MAPGKCKRVRYVAVGSMLVLALVPGAGAGSKATAPGPATVPQLELEGGRKLIYEGSFSSEADVRTKRGFWKHLLDVVAGEAQLHPMVLPYSVVTDSHNRVIVTDRGGAGIHIFDFAEHKYKFISRNHENDGLQAPQCVAVDAADNIYVTDSEAGKIFVFDSNGKFQRVIGSLKGGRDTLSVQPESRLILKPSGST